MSRRMKGSFPRSRHSSIAFGHCAHGSADCLRKISFFLLTPCRTGSILYTNFIVETVDAEITAVMTSQRACDGANQARNKLSNGPLRAQSNVKFTEYSATLWAGVQMPGIYWYPAKRTEQSVNQGGTADNADYSSLTEARFLSGTFSFSPNVPDGRYISPQKRRQGAMVLLTRRWRRSRKRCTRLAND